MNKNKKILLAIDTCPDNPWMRDRVPAILKSLRGYNYKIIDIFEFESKEEAHKLHRMSQRLIRQKHEILDINKKFLKRINHFNPDIVVMGTIDNYSRFILPETIHEMRKNGKLVVGIFGDDEIHPRKHKIYAPLFNVVVSYVKKYSDYYNNINNVDAFYMPNSCYFHEQDFEKLQNKNDYDVVLFGAPFGIRPVLVKSLIRAGVNIRVFGSGKWFNYKEIRNYYGGFVDSQDFDKVIRKSKIVLAPLECPDGINLHMNTKIWEAVRNGRMPIVTKYDPLVFDYGFREGEEIVFYKNPEDLVKKTIHYLDRDQERLQVARKIFHTTKDKFDYVKIYSSFFKKLEKMHDDLQKKNGCMVEYDNLITIIDNTNSNFVNQEGFSYFKYRDIKELICNFNQISTPYIIFRTKNFYYSPYLNNLLYEFPEEFKGSMRILKSSDSYSSNFLGFCDTNLIVWSKKEFSNFLENKFQKIKIINNFTKTNIILAEDLCDDSQKFSTPHRCLFLAKSQNLFKDLIRKISS
ncbi:MAG: glycosyltransferase [Candidatus Pacebacteria bacterium]|nr:glycosyltransferase [Candidatus Paceibacterota bacterium]